MLEGDKAVEATKKIAKASSRLLRASIKPKTSNEVALPNTTEHKQD